MKKILNNSYVFLLRQCLFYAQNWKRTYIKALALLTASHMVWLLRPLVLAGIINTLQKGGDDILKEVGMWLCVYAVVECLPWAVWKPARQMERSAAFHMRRGLIERFYAILQGLPIAWHQDHHSGDTINRVRKAADCLMQFGQNQFVYIMMMTQVIMSFGVIIYLSPLIGLIALVCTALAGFVVSRFDKVLIPLYSRENEGEHKVAATFFDYVSNITTIISLRLGLRTQANLLEKIDDIWPPFSKQIRIHETKYMLLTICIVVLDISIIGGYIWSQILTTGTVAIGTTVAIYQYLRLLSDTFYNFANNYQQVIRWKTDFEAVEQIATAAAAYAPVAEHDSPELSGWQALQIGALTFTHQRQNQAETIPAANLDKVSFALRRGEKVALIGASGAGKSTLLAILRGLYQPDQAQITVDGKPLENLAGLFGQTTLVPQDPEIFENTIRYNITIGLDVADAEIEQAVKLACFSDVVMRLPQGLESDIREKGVNLSGGEKQRLALARGLLAARNSSIILMDEPTSSVDLLTEGVIYRQVLEHTSGKTILSSLHRLHLLPLFDRILVMDNGRLIQDGNFHQLLAQDGLFRALWEDYQRQQNQLAA